MPERASGFDSRRPAAHRILCSGPIVLVVDRKTGDDPCRSAFSKLPPENGEDIVQDTLARAYYELSELKEVPALRPWLFRIAHHRALDFLRRYDRRMREPLEVAMARLSSGG
ncbi:MAG: hypothetical protein AUG04_10875 [Deltaproteobacteria bacterium 13_1_20CM_2_69_21]|nr:MAG: hypothetical protein AUH83_16525 [Deltaproteobacteria bacterium 13_1_40CM_4_68_19]OLD07199.1 MAG: hypothetical protein AUI90_10800 [Deltaproteobacteria bacterium 13_1_40CM_3_69_14]OLD36444.1 MAG: hypothetical protein AUI19_00810 [Myxococcales bacterium 13_1_40CM_2_68_15]OLE62259.1 MAG: hypothetical protein AUG04_10875 [Deltaproteobacteria bacterium 13_1_20CM_2_69_21]